MQIQELVSIVLPTYNGEKYIRAALNSIKAQTYPFWELIIVDDCSTDNTLKIANEYAKVDARIRVIHNRENKKLPRSLNIGFKETKGKYLTWTSDDNIYLPNALLEMIKYLIQEDCCMVSAGMHYIDENDTIIGTAKPYEEDRIYLQDTIGACFLYKREILDKIGEYDHKRVYVEDYDYWLRIKNYFGHIGCLDTILYLYRYHDGSLTATKTQEISYQLAALRHANLANVFAACKDKKNQLCQVYYDFIQSGYDMSQLKEKFFNEIPALRNESFDFIDNYIVFGAGVYGERAASCLKNKVICFCDNDQRLIGKHKSGLPIIAYDELTKQLSESRTTLMIAVSNIYIYEILQQITASGIRKYTTYQSYMSKGALR